MCHLLRRSGDPQPTMGPSFLCSSRNIQAGVPLVEFWHHRLLCRCRYLDAPALPIAWAARSSRAPRTSGRGARSFGRGSLTGRPPRHSSWPRWPHYDHAEGFQLRETLADRPQAVPVLIRWRMGPAFCPPAQCVAPIVGSAIGTVSGSTSSNAPHLASTLKEAGSSGVRAASKISVRFAYLAHRRT